MRWSLFSLLLGGLAVGSTAPLACSSGDTSGSPAGDDASTGPGDAAPPAPARDGGSDGGADTGTVADAGGGDSGGDADAGPQCAPPLIPLTVKNYLMWCSVSVAGGPVSTVAEQDVCVPAGTVTMSAVALLGFQLGAAPWHDTAGDTGSGELGTVSGTGQAAQAEVSVVVSSGPGKCVWVCCEFEGGGGCPKTDQCPAGAGDAGPSDAGDAGDAAPCYLLDADGGYLLDADGGRLRC